MKRPRAQIFVSAAFAVLGVVLVMIGNEALVGTGIFSVFAALIIWAT